MSRQWPSNWDAHNLGGLKKIEIVVRKEFKLLFKPSLVAFLYVFYNVQIDLDNNTYSNISRYMFVCFVFMCNHKEINYNTQKSSFLEKQNYI